MYFAFPFTSLASVSHERNTLLQNTNILIEEKKNTRNTEYYQMYFAFPFTVLTSVYTSSLQDGANIEVCRRNIYARAKCTIGKHRETF